MGRKRTAISLSTDCWTSVTTLLTTSATAPAASAFPPTSWRLVCAMAVTAGVSALLPVSDWTVTARWGELDVVLSLEQIGVTNFGKNGALW